MTILGVKPAEGDRPRRLSGRDAERILAGELLEAMRAQAQTHTEFAARLEGRLANDTLVTATRTFGTDGFIAEKFGVAAGAIIVTNLSTPTAATTSTAPASTVGANPAAGAEVSVTVPAGEQWQLQSVDVTLVTSAGVANRRVVLVIDDGVNVLAKVTAVADQTATQTIEYVFAGSVENSAARNGVQLEPLPALTLGAGYRIRTVTTNLQAGDDYGAPVIGYLKTTSTAAATGNTVTVNAAGPGPAAPGSGVGVFLVRPGATKTIPLASRQVTLYGTNGDQVEYVVVTKAVEPTAL